MAQAEIDPETLKALNSFYIDKPENYGQKRTGPSLKIAEN